MTKSTRPINAEEFELFQALRPYITRCLTLNHDLNNPLSGVVGFGELLLEDADDWSESQRDTLKSLLECADRIKSIIDEFSELKIKLSEEVDLNTVMKTFQQK